MIQPKRKKIDNENGVPLTIGTVVLAVILGGMLSLACEPPPLKPGPTAMPVLQPSDPREIAAKQHNLVYGALRRYLDASQSNALDYASWASTAITADAAFAQAQRRGDTAKIEEYTKHRKNLKEIIDELDAANHRLRLDLSELRLRMAEWDLRNPGLWLYPYQGEK